MKRFFASRALAPVDRMIRQVELISAEQLDRRLDVPQTGDELERLAVTFNLLLDRIDSGTKQLKQFGSAASHELRTPLTVMRGELELALGRPREIEEYQRVIRTQLETIDELTRIVKEFLSLAQSEAVEEKLSISSVTLNDVIARAQQSWSGVAESRQVRFTVTTAGPLVVDADPRLMERLLANLLDNAFKHTPRGGRISVELAQAGNEARLSVHDSGPGIPEDDISEIFNRFHSRRPSGGDDTSPARLGLGLCKWIVEAHKGKIEVLNGHRGGSSFTVFLPLARSASTVLSR